MKLKTFVLGGVHPEENKLTEKKEIEIFPLPDKVIVLLTQHMGIPAVPVVKKGDVVKTGQLIGRAEGFISANVHSPVSGVVEKVDTFPDSSGYRKPAIFITREVDEWIDGIDLSPELKREIRLSSSEIIEKIKEMGIVGLGGATFPTHVKLSVPSGKKAEFLIINGVECEPYLTADHRLMLERTEEIMVGITILMKALQVDKALVGIENNKPDAIARMSEIATSYSGISIHPLKVKYPQGAEKQLIKALVNREVPSGKLPIDVGCVVQNVGTALAVYEAVQKNKPLIERVVTITGKSLVNSGNFLVRIGTSIDLLIKHAGGLPEDTYKVVNGGPMMGKALYSLETTVTKGTSGILVLNETDSKRKEPYVCIRCARCVDVCPMGLEPYFLYNLSRKERWETMKIRSVMDCIECGSCQYTCPSYLPLLDGVRLGKNKVAMMLKTASQSK
ncbi:MAG: electron transport complex subunit RsxC [Bacteroidales bacterium]|nr:electron transport complex subunit RsxC [Bacteroidales bacterium]